MLTKSTIVPGTLGDFRLGIDMKVHAFLTTGTLPISGVEPALRHLFHVVLMEELALILLFTQPTQPMFADDRLLRSEMLVWTLEPS